MSEKLTSVQLHRALMSLGGLLPFQAALTIGGSSALLLTGALDRVTDDCDVVESSVDFSRLLESIRRVETVDHAPPGWLNTSIQVHLDALPPKYRERLVALPRMGQLAVSLLSRADVLAMKLYAGRPRDVQDILLVAPTPVELAFMETDIARVAAKEPERATRMQGRLEDLRGHLARPQRGPAR